MKILNIRSANRQDIESIREIARITDLFPPEMLDAMIAGYLDLTKTDIWFVGELDNKVHAFGFCEQERMTEGTWNLLAIGVKPYKQNSGIGTKMMQYLEEILLNKGARVLIVETMGTTELELTRKFYIKNNYIEEARIREFYEAGADKVIYWKKL